MNTEDVLIDWSKAIYINFAQSEVLDKIADNYESIGEVDRLTAEMFIYNPSQLISPEKFERYELNSFFSKKREKQSI